MKNAILLFHASQLGDNLHPFLINETKHFKDKYDNVFVFCLTPSCGTSSLEDDRVHFVTVKLLSLYFRLWLIIPDLFSAYLWRDIHIAIKNKVFDIQYLKMTAMQLIYGRYFSKIANKIINRSPDDEWVIDSYWLTGPAYAAAKIKKKNSQVVAFSRLHSSEADIVRNKYAICQMKGFIDKYLDYIFFVSAKGKESYLQIMDKFYSGSRDNDRYIVNRLGVEDYCNKGIPSNDGTFRILSCSRVVTLKRVPMLAEVFSQWNGPQIEWTHIGDGDEFEYVKQIISKNKSNSNSRCILLGNLPHNEVIEYYRNNPIDAFINISKFEGLPVTIMEAMSFGVPVIATNAGGSAELVDKDNGLLIDIAVSRETIENAVRSIMSLKDDEYYHMREMAYKKYCKLLDSNANFEQLSQIVEQHSIVKGS